MPWFHDSSSPMIDKVKPLQDASSLSNLSADIREEITSEYDSKEDSEDQASVILINETTLEKLPEGCNESKNNDKTIAKKHENDSQLLIKNQSTHKEAPSSAINVPLVTLQIKKDNLQMNSESVDASKKIAKKVDELISAQSAKIEEINHKPVTELNKEKNMGKSNFQDDQLTIREDQISHMNTDKSSDSRSISMHEKSNKTEKKNLEKLKTQTSIDKESTQLILSPNCNNEYHTVKKQLDRKIIEKRLIEKYPFMFAIIYCEILVISSIAKIVLQVILMLHDAPYNYLSCGIISGLVGLVIFVWIINTSNIV